MLTIQSSETSVGTCKLNVVPCRIHHTGPTKITKRYWSPSTEKDASQTAFFRGRKLRGRTVKLPSNYEGLVLKSTDKTIAPTQPRAPMPHYDEYEDDDEDSGRDEQNDMSEPVRILEKVSTFDEIVVWGHDQIPSSEDAFARNIEEWISFAEAIHGNDNTPDTASAGQSKNSTTDG